jgi:excisionase family DNA binding protein
MAQSALSVNQATKALSIHRATLYRELKAGHIEARKIGRKTVILIDEIERYLNSRPVAPISEAA